MPQLRPAIVIVAQSNPRTLAPARA